MRAITVSAAGSPPAPSDVRRPEPGPGEVLVRVQSASLNGFDAATVSGMLTGLMEHRYPLVPGKDFAGVVEAVGEGATRFGVGDAVLGVVMRPYIGDGSLAELVAVHEQSGITAIPDGMDVTAAGALGLAGTAALDSLAAVAPHRGETLLVVGATGGVGAIAVQYAAASGAVVIATARPGAEEAVVRELGAHHVVDPAGDLPAQVRALAPDGVDAALHLAGDLAEVVSLTAPAGRVASTLVFGPDHDPKVTPIYADPTPATLERLAADATAGRIRVPIRHTYALDDVPQAMADFTAGTIGKLAVRVP
jgi:NADPH:quinone reductase-like Zn-dependent oxidoreductase